MFFVSPRVPPLRGCTLGYYYVALTGSSFRSPAARPNSNLLRRGGASSNVADISILYKIFGTHVPPPLNGEF
ncbi:MAG: hypothetical protein J6J97_01600 [Akkermansia sp.]|nr:hypothetical protein [Akkermansia sp.]